MKKKGFTLIELIVVIAIIGVLAAILVPAMLGYVKKSKITTANTTAKSIYNAFNSSLTDMDSMDVKIKNLDGNGTIDACTLDGKGWDTISIVDKASANANSNSMVNMLKYKVNTYFTDIIKVSEFEVYINQGGACVAAGAMNGAYPGGYPNPVTVDEYNVGSVTCLSQAMAKQPS